MSAADVPSGHARFPLLNPLPLTGEEANEKGDFHIKPLTFALLRCLADGDYHSGEVLGRQFGVTRTTVHNALHDVANFGLTLYSVRGRGYRLAQPLHWLDAELIRAKLGPACDGLRIEILDHAPSSNALLLQRCAQLRHGAAEPMGAGATAVRLLPQTAGFASNVSEVQLRHGAAEPMGAGATAVRLLPQTAGFASNVSEAQGAPSGTVLAVEWQSAGRGRLGRTWHSGLGDALTFSLLWRFESGLAALSGLSLAVGVGMMRALHELGVSGAGLKWPNDVLLNKGKLAGILLEAQGDMLGPSAVVIGIGLNLSVPEALRERIEQPVSDLSSLEMPVPERNLVLAVSLKHLVAVLRTFAVHGFAPLRAEWESHHVYQNQPVKMLLTDGSQAAGTVLGVTDDGALRLGTERGEQVFNAGEVSLRSG